MKTRPILPGAIGLLLFHLSCHPNHQNTSPQSETDSSGKVVRSPNIIPEFRKEIKKETVAEYKEKTDNPLNDWYFSVALYETPRTFHYLMKIQFEEVKGEDTLKLPNFGYVLKPVIRKGKDKYSCIVGFLDNENKFREYKLVHVENGNQLKITTLKHYAVATYAQ